MRKVIVGVLLTSAAALAGLSAQTPSELEDDRWVSEFERPAWDSLMPLESPGQMGPGQVGYRSYHDKSYQELERYFAIGFSFDHPSDRNLLSATIVIPIGSSIRRQLLELHKKDRGLPFDAVLSRVSVRRVSLRAATCRAIPNQMNALSKVRVTVPDQELRILDPFVHRVVVDLNNLRLDATVTDKKNPLVGWAVATHAALLGCVRQEKP